MQKRRPGQGGADLLSGDLRTHTAFTLPRPLVDELSSLRALHLIHALGLRPELAAMLASLAFGGAA